MPTPDLKPAISVCCHCPNLYFDFIEVRDFQDEMPADYQGYWVCGLLKNGTALFFDEPQEVKAHDDIIRLEVEAMPENCPYFLEQFYSQDTAGQERWSEVLPMLKKRI